MSQGPGHLEELLRHRDFVRRLARRLVRDEARAEDVVQDTYVAALRNPPRHAGALRAWLASVVRKIAFTQRRSEKRRQNREQAARSARELPSPETVAEKAQWHQRVVNAVMQLEDPYKATLLLRYFEDLNSSEIAAVHGVPAATVRTRIKRGLEQVRERLDRAATGGRAEWMHGLLLLGWRPDELAAAARAVERPTATTPWPFAAAAAGVIAVLGFVLFATGGTDGEDPARRSSAPAPAPAASAETGRGAFVHAAEPVGTPLEVTVLGAGRPVSDALVVVARRVGHAWRFSPRDRWAEWDRTRTDGRGAAVFSSMPRGHVRVFAVSPGFSRATATVHGPREFASPVVLELSKERPLAFRVVEAGTGDPIAGVRVGLLDWLPAATARSGADGTGVLGGVPRDGRCVIVATADGYAPCAPRAPPEDGLLELRLEPRQRTLRWPVLDAPAGSAPVTVRRLTDAAGRPGRIESGHLVARGFARGVVPELLAIAADGSFARLSAPGEAARFRHPPRLTLRARDPHGAVHGIDVQLVNAAGHPVHPVGRTDADGRLALPVYAAERMEVRVRDGRDAVYRAVGWFDPAGGDAVLDVELPPGREVELRVRGGFPPGTEIVAGRTLVDAERMVRGGRRFRVRGVTPVPVHVLAPGHLPAATKVDPAGRGPVRVELELVRAVELTVQVVRTAQQPYRLELISADPKAALPRRGPWQFRLYLGPDDMVRETMVPPGRYRVRDRVTGLQSRIIAAGSRPVFLRLDLSRAWPPAPLAVRGRVAPVPGLDLSAAEVVVEPQDGDADRRTVRVGDDGAFTLPWDDRPVRIVVRHPYAAPGRAVTLTAPRDDVVLELRPHRARLRLDPGPERLEEYETAPRIRLVTESGTRTFAAALERGELRFAGFAPQRATLWIDVAGFAPAELKDVDLRPGETDLGTLALRRGASLRLRVIGRAGEPLPSLIVSAQGDGYQRSLHTGGRGVATLSGLGPGVFHVNAWESPGGFRVFKAKVKTDGDAVQDVEIDLR